MNQEQSPTGLYKTISTFADIIAVVAVIMVTPHVFNLTKRPLFSYFIKYWGRDFAELLVWVMGAIEAYLIFMATSLLLTGTVIWLVTTLIMRRFKD